MPIFTKRTVIYFSCCGNVDSLRSRIDYILLGLFLIEFMVKGNSLQDIKTMFVSMATPSTLKAMTIILISPSTTLKNIKLDASAEKGFIIPTETRDTSDLCDPHPWNQGTNMFCWRQ